MPWPVSMLMRRSTGRPEDVAACRRARGLGLAARGGGRGLWVRVVNPFLFLGRVAGGSPPPAELAAAARVRRGHGAGATEPPPAALGKVRLHRNAVAAVAREEHRV